MKSWRSGIIAFAACVLVLIIGAGCLPFPLGDPATAKVDAKLVGFWLNNADGDRDLIALYPYDEHTYVMQDQKIHQEDGKWTAQGPPMIFKAWIVEVKGHRFISLEPLFQKIVAQDHSVYPTLHVDAVAEGLKVRLVDSDFEPLKTVKSAAEELAVVTKELDNPKLLGDATTFHKLDFGKDADTIALVVKP